MSVINQMTANATMDHILHLVKKRKQFRTGVVYSTEMNNYFYDTGTGKILKLSDVEYRLLKSIFNKDATEKAVLSAFQAEKDEDVKLFLRNTEELRLMRAPDLTEYKYSDYEEIFDKIDNELTQLILEVTQQCNFRCKYCIYNSFYAGNHDFSSSEMSWETAKASIDYLLSHSSRKERIYVTFYGGEPLLRFDLIKKCVNYTLRNVHGKKVYFNLTTNLSLMDSEKAQYFADVPNFNLTVSLDGPNEFNKYRVYVDGRETFYDVISGLQNVCREFSRAERPLTISAVLAPPYNYEKLDAVNDFFESIPEVPKGTSIFITYPSAGTFNSAEYVSTVYDNPRYWMYGDFDPLGKWQLNQCIKHSLSWDHTNNLYFRSLVESMKRIKSRFGSEEPALQTNCIQACCIPGVRKLYVLANGDLTICERIGSSPFIGNIKTGLNKEEIVKKYIDEYMEKSKSECANCWAFNLCSMCYAMCFDKEGVNMKKKYEECIVCRTHSYMQLTEFSEIMEKCPDAMKAVEKATIV